MEAPEQPMGLVSLNELNALSVILHYYERHLWNAALPSWERSRQSVEIYALTVKLSLLQVGQVATLTEDDIKCITAALDVFTSEVLRRIMPSESRDGILTSCKQLREYLTTIFPSE